MYKFTLAIRYFIKRRINYFAVAAVALCVFVVFVVITVLSGLSRDFKYKVYSSVGDCVVHTKSLVGFGYYDEFLDILKEQDFIEAATPIVRSYGLVSPIDTAGLDIYGEDVREIVGIEPVSLSKVMDFKKWIEFHKDNVANVFQPAYDTNLPGCVPGIDVIYNKDQQGSYNTLGRLVRASFEISCVPLTAKGALAKAGTGEFNSKTFYYSDHFEAGYSLDRRLIFLPLKDAQLLCGMGTGHKRITHIHIKFTQGTGINDGTQKVKKLWADFIAAKESVPHANLLRAVYVQSWKDFSKTIVALVETQQTMMIVSFALIGIIAVFIVLVVFYMLVSHKTKDIGILKSVGASGINIVSVFLHLSLLISITGSAIGTLGGWLFLSRINSIEDWLFEKYEFQLWDRQISSIGDIPNQIDLTVLAVIILCAVAACLIGALLPSWRASRTKCVDTLQVAQL